MRTFSAALLFAGASAWNAADYSRYQNQYNASEYEPIQHVELHEQELPIAYQPALTEETEIETIEDRALWNKLQRFQGLEYYTHAHHDSDQEDTHPNSDHEYPEEHHHYRHIEYLDRQPVVINRQRKVYHVQPERYVRSYDDAAPQELVYAEDFINPTMKPDTTHTAKFLKAHARAKEPQFGDGAYDGVHMFFMTEPFN